MYQSRHLANTRIDVADALRGIAVAGIILYHSVEHFNIFTQEPITHTLATDQMVADVLAWLLSGKMYGIFAMLFGLSFFIMNDNQQQKGNNFSGRFAWRMCLLFLFGIINVAFYDGDILMLYACYGLLLIPISYLPSKWVWCIIALLAIQPVELFCLLTGTTIDHSTLWEVYSKINRAHEHGTFWENTLTNLRYGFEVNFRFNIFSGRLTQLLCLFILGMQLGRQRMFYNEGRNLQIWHQLLWRSALVVVVLSIVDFSEIASWLNPIYNLTILMIHRLCYLLRLWPGLLSPFRCYLCCDGRMWHGCLSVSLCQILVLQSSSRSVRGALEKTDMDEVVAADNRFGVTSLLCLQ